MVACLYRALKTVGGKKDLRLDLLKKYETVMTTILMVN